MATVQLADVYVPKPFDQAVAEKAIELNRFISSGVMSNDPTISAMAEIGGWTGELPHYNALVTSTEPNYDSDVSGTDSTPAKIGIGTQKYRRHKMNASWSTMDLTRSLALADPLAAITSMIGKYWAVQNEKRLLKSLDGILSDNIANDSGDMVNVIHLETTDSHSSVNDVSANAVIDAAQTMGDHKELISVIAMHSVVYTNLQKANLIAFVPNARGEVILATYLGYTVIVDDSMTLRDGTTTATKSKVYTTILFAPGAVAFGDGAPAMIPSELERNPAAGHGGGQDILHSRVGGIIHPRGFTSTGTPGTSTSFTLSELATASSWDRVYKRKNIGIAFLTSNG